MDQDQLQQFCEAMPGATVDIKWEDHLCFCVGAKMFAIYSPSGEPSLSFKADADLYHQLIQQDGVVSAPYLGRYKWVMLERMDALPRETLENLLRDSYGLVFAKLTRKLRREIEAGVGAR